jgi:hypothetical protein
MYSVRFHLGRGPYYKYWQIRDLDDKDTGPKYIDPETSQLVLVDCELVCNERTAKKVHAIGRKDVCGWVKCEHVYWHDLHISNPINIDGYSHLTFNPIVDPHWRIKGSDYTVNGLTTEKLVTFRNKIYCPLSIVDIEKTYELQHAPC